MRKIDLVPGVLSHRFISGRQVSLLTPVIMFFIANIISFAGNIPSDLYTQTNNMPYSNIATDIVEKKVKKNKTSIRKFTVTYEARAWWMSRALLVLTVFYFSFALFFINYRKGLSYVDHLAVSFEFMTFVTLLIFTALSWIPVLIVSLLAAAVLLYFFERNAYRKRKFRSVTDAALLVFLFYGVILFYRSTVFFITILTF